ncbi:Protein furry [Frankliniella fusca]|uniref:Protein furry n=1 Tax=Frankliniella fusca TaxID=407009 RepID=A0AAE1LIS8_9NEOP|nr:Protein furry [Frankliniella fusca]
MELVDPSVPPANPLSYFQHPPLADGLTTFRIIYATRSNRSNPAARVLGTRVASTD